MKRSCKKSTPNAIKKLSVDREKLEKCLEVFIVALDKDNGCMHVISALAKKKYIFRNRLDRTCSQFYDKGWRKQKAHECFSDCDWNHQRVEWDKEERSRERKISKGHVMLGLVLICLQYRQVDLTKQEVSVCHPLPSSHSLCSPLPCTMPGRQPDFGSLRIPGPLASH